MSNPDGDSESPDGSRDILINLVDCPVYEAGAALVTMLALPDGSDRDRGKMHASLCAMALRAMHPNFDEPEARQSQSIKPAYALRDLKQIERDQRKLGLRLRNRMVAGRMAWVYLDKFLFPNEFKLPGGIRGTSLDEVSDLVLRDTDLRNSANVQTRIWRPSRPVIHLAAAISSLGADMEKAGIGPIELKYLMFDPFVIDGVVRRSQKYAHIIENNKVLPGRAVPLVHFRLPAY